MTTLEDYTPPASENPEVEPKKKRDDDFLLAALFWNAANADEYRGMLTENNGWRWDAEQQTFVSGSGTALRQDTLRHLALGLVDRTELMIENLTVEMVNDKIAVDDWVERFQRIVFNEQIALMLLAAGGVDNYTDEDLETLWGNVGSLPETQGTGLSETLVRLHNFADEIRNDEAGSDKFIVSRAGGYTIYGYPVYANVRENSHKRAVDEDGKPLFLFELNILDPTAKHCHDGQYTDGCVEITAAGPQPIGTMTKIGHRTCGNADRCWTAYFLIPPTE